jgi:hypothetical protein
VKPRIIQVIEEEDHFKNRTATVVVIEYDVFRFLFVPGHFHRNQTTEKLGRLKKGYNLKWRID